MNYSAKHAGEKTPRFHRLNIGPRLTLCFAFIILAMLVGSAVALWQFQIVRSQTERLRGVDQMLILVLQAHTNLMSFYQRLDAFAHSEDTAGLVREAEPLRNALLEDSRGTRNALGRLPAQVQLDPTLLPTLEAIQGALPAQLEAITSLATSADWEAVRLRVANQVRELESSMSALVKNIDGEVGEQRAEALFNIEQAQRRILLVVPATAVFTLLFAALLGLAITRSITRPLGQLMEASKALGRGEFQNRVSVVGNDELAHLGRVFNNTAGTLRELYEAVRTREAYLAEAQRVSHTGSWGWNLSSGELVWSDETFRIFEYSQTAKPSLELVLQRTHPDDVALMQRLFDRVSRGEPDWDLEHRLLMPDGSVKHLHVIGRASNSSPGDLEYVGAVTDVTAAKQAEAKLRESEAYLAEAQRLSHTGSWAWNPTTGENTYWSDECFRLMGFDPAGGMPPFETVAKRFHPDDQPKFAEKLERAKRERADFEVDYRIIHPGGELRDIHAVGHPVLGPSGDLIDFVGSVIDVTERKQAEANIRQSENELRHILDFAPQQVAVLGPDGTRIYSNQANLDYLGFTLEEWRSVDPRRFVHRDDFERVTSQTHDKLLNGLPHEIEMRLRGTDEKYRWFLLRYSPLRDEQGRITRWYIAGTDIEDRKQTEQRLQNENVALREEIDKASMFEQIVGTSPPLRNVLSRVSKVAPTDSGVLITGETGTGKELVARAIHRRSRRASRPFVSVNCAAVPRDLIASELFGHEKGAFTGATQRRLGRFELAEGGTIFLDEVGELPAETQIALLRVLQEREFERVGGTGSIRSDVRVIAATNRDMEAVIAAGVFRSDLFYRLNVFPIEMPSLRERREDIPLLVEYFIDRFSRQAGKNFQAVTKRSLDLLQSYPWPGNIRELQNVIERSVIVCETENFSVDESWLSRQPLATETNTGPALFMKIPSQEKEVIEAALRESGGRVYGPSGAAAKLGMPRSTLESKIRSFKIDKKRFKAAASS
jgi:formate hydrogenlyase transcriptional activator